MEEDGQLTQFDIVEMQTHKETDFGGFLRYLAQDGIPLLQSTRNPFQTEEEHNDRMRFLIGYMTARVLFNRSNNGQSNDPNEIWTDRGLPMWVKEFIVDDDQRVLMGQGVAKGFAMAGIFPDNWQELANPDAQ